MLGLRLLFQRILDPSQTKNFTGPTLWNFDRVDLVSHAGSLCLVLNTISRPADDFLDGSSVRSKVNDPLPNAENPIRRIRNLPAVISSTRSIVRIFVQ